MQVAYPQAALDIIASTLLSSMVLLALSFVRFRGERAEFARHALVIVSLVLQASCIGTVWLHEGRGAMSTALLIVAIATVVILTIVAIRRDRIWTR
jgi:cytochrome c oxidase subunit IV